ncbi:MAG TPA: hypothetical protein VLA43_00955, partial [Longimicrobiales bacterium]|nr:hypothetical protein [Longimicrobiales bacterium]
GSLESLAESVDSARVALERLFLGLPMADPRERAVRDGLTAMMDAALSAGDTSLVKILDGTSSLWGGGPPDLTLVDALLASTGTLDRFRALAEALRGPETPAAQLASALDSPYCIGEPAPDLDLACLMQMTVILDSFTQYFVKPVAEAYNLTVGLGAGLAAISGVGTAVGTAASVTGAVLAIEAFVMEKLVVAALPTEIVAFAATMESDTVGVGELTRTNIVLTAQNEPIPITLNDMVSVIMSSMSFVEVEAAEGFAAVLMRAALFVLEQYRGILLTYEAAHPGSFTDPELTSVPLLLYGPVFVTHPDLVKLHTLAPEILQPQDSVLEWKALQRGSGAVRAETRGAESRAKVVRDWMLLTSYTGGAFGEELVSTDNMTVVVSNEGDLAVTIFGLPDGALASVAVSGPGGFGATVTQSDTLRKLEVGEYTVRGYPVTVEGTTYGADPDEQTITVLDRETVDATVGYAPNSSSLEVVIEGLPSSLDADVSVSGPGGFSRQITQSTTFDSLAAGLYNVTVNAVTSPLGVAFPPETPSISVDVPERGSATATAKYKNPMRLTLLAGWVDNGSGVVPPQRSASLGYVSAGAGGTVESQYVPLSSMDPYAMGECYPVGPVLISDDWSQSWTMHASEAGQDATGQLTIEMSEDRKTLSFTFDGTANGSPPPLNPLYPDSYVQGSGVGRAGSVGGTWKGLVLLIETFGLTADLEVSWSVARETGSSDTGTPDSWATAYTSLGMVPQIPCQFSPNLSPGS